MQMNFYFLLKRRKAIMLSIKNLNKSYGKKQILYDVNIDIEAGDIYGFIGKNGAGKTTTIKCVVGLNDYKEGEIYVNGINIKTDPLKAKSVMAYIPDNPELYEFMRGTEYLNFIANVYDLSEEKRKSNIEKYLKIFDLEDAIKDFISSYSHGMKQKLALIAALMHEPKLLILDEPFVGLDPTATHYLKEEFKEMVKSGAAIFFSTHVLEVAQSLCNKISILKDGRIIAQGDTKEVTEKASLEDIFMELMKNEI